MNKHDFDKWSETYDEDIKDEKTYPFVGYSDIVEEIIYQAEGEKILDLGVGTGNISKILYDKGYKITGLDFSTEMINKAKEKMPDGEFIVFDGNDSLPRFVEDFDTVIMNYFIHHFNYMKQSEIIEGLMNISKKIIIGDVMTKTKEEMIEVKDKNMDSWDDEEFYPIVDEIILNYPDYNIEFIKKSYCSGVIVITH